MKVEKIQIAKCKVCEGIIMASVFPLFDDSEAIREFKELHNEGHEIDLIPNPEKLNWCSCNTVNPFYLDKLLDKCVI